MNLVYTLFITNNHASFHLWWKKQCLECLLKVFWCQIWASIKRSVKIGKDQVRQNLALFLNLFALIVSWNCVYSLTVIKIVQEVKFEGKWGELETKDCFKRQSWAKYIGRWIFMVFPNFLRSKVLNRLATRQATVIYHFYYQWSCFVSLWGKEIW